MSYPHNPFENRPATEAGRQEIKAETETQRHERMFDMSATYSLEDFLRILRASIQFHLDNFDHASARLLPVLEIWQERAQQMLETEDADTTIVGFNKGADGIARIYFSYRAPIVR